MDLGIPFVPQPAARPPAAPPARPAPDAAGASFDDVLQTSMSGAGAERPAHAPVRARSGGAKPGAAEPAPVLASGAANAVPGTRASGEGQRAAREAVSPAVNQAAGTPVSAAENVPASDVPVTAVTASPDATPPAATPDAAPCASDDATATDAGVDGIEVSADEDGTFAVAVVDVAATAVIWPTTPDPVPDAAPTPTPTPAADAVAASSTLSVQAQAVAPPVVAQPGAAPATTPASSAPSASDAPAVQATATQMRAVAARPAVAGRTMGSDAIPDAEPGVPVGPSPGPARSNPPAASSPVDQAAQVAHLLPAQVEPTTATSDAAGAAEPTAAVPLDVEPTVPVRPEPMPAGARPAIQPGVSPKVDAVAVRVARALSPLAEQVKAIIDAAAVTEPALTESEPSANAVATPPTAAADAHAPAPDRAQAMARAIVRASVEGLVLAGDTGDAAMPAPIAPPAGTKSEAASPTLMPHLFAVNPLVARNDARAAYAGEPATAAANAPVLPPVAPTPDASFDQPSSSSGHAPAPRSEMATFVASDAPTDAVFTLPALLPETLTLGGVATATGTPSGASVTMTELPRQIVRSIVVQVAGGVSEARLRINPAHLGEVTVRLRVERDGVTAVLHADSPQVSAWIEAHQEDLRAALSAQGLQLEGLTVTTDPDERRREQPEPEARRRARPRAADAGKTFDLMV